MEKGDLIAALNSFLAGGNRMVASMVPILANVADMSAITDLHIGTVRTQGIDSKTGSIHLSIGAPGQTTNRESTLKTNVSEDETFAHPVVIFNNVDSVVDCNAYFEGYKVILQTLNP